MFRLGEMLEHSLTQIKYEQRIFSRGKRYESSKEDQLVMIRDYKKNSSCTKPTIKQVFGKKIYCQREYVVKS